MIENEKIYKVKAQEQADAVTASGIKTLLDKFILNANTKQTASETHATSVTELDAINAIVTAGNTSVVAATSALATTTTDLATATLEKTSRDTKNAEYTAANTIVSSKETDIGAAFSAYDDSTENVNNKGIEIGNKTIDISEGDELFIEKYQAHRVRSEGLIDLVIIEIQTGVCNEDDIIRIEDDFGRVE